MQRLDPIIKIVLYFVLYTVYRLVRVIIYVESDLVALIKRLQQSENTPVEVFTILTRFRLDKNDIPRETDFMLFNESFTSFDEICGIRWHIYHISDRYVYFVQSPEEEVGHILHAPKMVQWLFSQGEKVARISTDEFVKKASSLACLKSKILFLHSLPAGGGTQTAQLLQAADSSLKSLEVWGEPPVLTALATLSTIISIEKMNAITKAALRLVFLNFERGKTVIFKTRSCCSKIVPFVHVSYPSIQHAYVTTRDPMDCVQRLVEDNSEHLPVFDWICRLLSHSPSVCDFFFGWRQLEPEAITNVGPNDPYEFALSLVLGSTIAHQRNLKYFALDPIYFEDLLNDLHNVIRPLMEICEISDLALHECISFKRQEDAAFRRYSTIHSLPIELQERLKYLTDLIQREWNR